MPVEPVHPDLVKIALDKAEGFQFERFVNDFYPSIVGARFVPVGGMHDGGADAFAGSPVHEEVGAPTVFYQASVQEDFRGKIRHTVKRLRESGRDPRSLVYVTSRTISLPDAEERALTRELHVAVQIRDAKYIVAHVNDTAGTMAAFHHHLRHLTDFLRNIGAPGIIAPSSHVRSPAVYVFLEQELARQRGDTTLLESVTDALILWALEGTDPDAGLTMSRQDVLEKISVEIPAQQDGRPSLGGANAGNGGVPQPGRLRWLSLKVTGNLHPARWDVG
jgi:hypothetical protein